MGKISVNLVLRKGARNKRPVKVMKPKLSVILAALFQPVGFCLELKYFASTMHAKPCIVKKQKFSNVTLRQTLHIINSWKAPLTINAIKPRPCLVEKNPSGF